MPRLPFFPVRKKDRAAPTARATADPVLVVPPPDPLEEVTRETVVEASTIKRTLGATIDPWERLDRQGI
jgi:hypothetical protein